MALVVKDRIKEVTSTTGTGTLTLAGAVTKFQSFSVVGDGNTTYYAIESGNGSDWEIGVGTYTASGTTLSRDTILESSNAGSAISLSGTSTVFCTYPAERSVNTADIGSTIQGYDADTAKYDDTTANFVGTLQNGGSNVVVDTDIGSTVQGYDADTAKLDVVQTFTAAQTFSTDATINGLTVGKGANAVATNTALGVSALSAATSGISNIGVGYQSLSAITTGSRNTAVGYAALRDSVNDTDNVAVGYFALEANVGGDYNTAIGVQALLSNTTANNNTAVGYQALALNTTASNNTAVGHSALLTNSTGAALTAVGRQALSANTTADGCTAVGYQALVNNTTGIYNTSIGNVSMTANTTGFRNTALGHSAGGTITTGSYNTCLGHDAEPSSATAVGEFTLGDSNVSNLRCNDTSISSLSDSRDKTNVVDIPLGLEFINKMRPVAFDWDRRDGSMAGKKDFGFIAQELKTIQDETAYAEHLRLVHDDNPEKLEADPMKTYPVLIKAIQELSAKVDALQTEINVLKGE